MSKLLLLIAMYVAAPSVPQTRDVADAVLVADRIAQANDANSDVWKNTESVQLEGLPAWYKSLHGRAKESYDELRRFVWKSRCFKKPIVLRLDVSSSQESGDGSIRLLGSVRARTEATEDYYTPDQRAQIDSMKRAIRDKQDRHNHDMIRLSDGTPYKLERVQLFHDAIIEMGEKIQAMHTKFGPEAAKRKVRGEQVLVRVVVSAAESESIDPSKLDRLREVELIMNVVDFHIRPPIAEFARPIAIGMLMGEAAQIGEVTYRPPVSELPPETPADRHD